MSRSLLVAFLAAAFLVAPATFAPVTTPGFSGSTQAAVTVNNSKSNHFRTNKPRKEEGPHKGNTGGPTSIAPRMGGGGGTGHK